tara:strand:+ start:185 stop:424 length:240 start_codon:yes stop_codon:yes gene_type:complete
LGNKFDKFKWLSVPFNKSSLTKLDDEKGLYFFAIAPNIAGTLEHVKYLCYIGETKHLKTRFQQYLNKAQFDAIYRTALE